MTIDFLDPEMPVSRKALLVLLPVMLGGLFYLPSLGAGYAFDDAVAIEGNPIVRGDAPWTDAWTRNFWGDRPGFEHLASWRPLTALSLRLDAAMGAGAPAVFHGTNLLLHGAVIGLLALLALGLGLSLWVALALATCFALHPMASEAVVSVVGRGDLLATALGLASLVALNRGRGAGWGLVCLALALLAKETGVIFAGAFLGWAWLRGRRHVAWCAVAVVAGWYVLRASVVGHLAGAVPAVDNPIVTLEGAAHLQASLAVVGRYLSWLWPQAVAPDYAAGVTLTGATGGYGWLGGGGLLCLALLWIWSLRSRNPEAGLSATRGALWVGTTVGLTGLVLLSNGLFVLPTPLAGRLAYGLCACLLLALVALLCEVLGRRPWVVGGLVLLVTVWGLAPASSIVDAWQDDAHLFAYAVEVEPQSSRSRVNHALQRLADGDVSGAEGQLMAALEQSPDYPPALLNLALVHQALGREDDAWRVAQRAVALALAPGRAHANLCALGLKRAEVTPVNLGAVCEAGAKGLPGDVEAQVGLARAWARLGRIEAADRLFLRLSDAHPSSVFALGHRVTFLTSQGRMDDALVLQRRLVNLAPQDPGHVRNLVALLLREGDARADAGALPAACALWAEVQRRTGGAAFMNARMGRCETP